MRINVAVETPLGQGVVQGRWSESAWLIRLPVNDATRIQLKGSITPRATISGLWIFDEVNIKESNGVR